MERAGRYPTARVLRSPESRGPWPGSVLEAVIEHQRARSAAPEGDRPCLVPALPHHHRHAGEALGQEHRLVAGIPGAEQDTATVRHDANAARAPPISPADDGGPRSHVGQRERDHLGQRCLPASPHCDVADRDDRNGQGAGGQYADPVGSGACREGRAVGSRRHAEPGTHHGTRPAMPGFVQPKLRRARGLSHARAPSGSAPRARGCA